jgi:hypothetical protein
MVAYLHGTLTQSFVDQSSRTTQTGLSSEEAAVLRLLKHRRAAG